MIAIVLLVLSVAWLVLQTWAIYKGAKATKGLASWVLWFGLVVGLLNLLLMAFILIVPTSSVAKWYNDLKTKAASSTEA